MKKDLFRNLIAGALCFSMCIALAPVSFALSDADRPKWYYDQNFEVVPEGAMPHELIATGYHGYYSRGDKGDLDVTTLSDGNKVLHFGANGLDTANSKTSDFITYTIDFTEVTTRPVGRVVAQWKMKFDNQDGCSQRYVIYDSRDEDPNNSSKDNYNLFLGSKTGTNGQGLGVYAGSTMTYVDGTTLPSAIGDPTMAKVSVAFNLDDGYYDLYYNDELAQANVPCSGIGDFESFVLGLYVTDSACNADMYIDDIQIFEGSGPLTQTQIDATNWDFVSRERSSVLSDESTRMLMNNRVAFFPGTPYANVKGTKTEIKVNGQNREPYEENNTLMVPAAFAVTSLGGVVLRTTTTSLLGKIGSKAVSLSGVGRDGVLYASVHDIARVTGKQIFLDQTGLAVLGDVPFDYSWKYDDKILKSVISTLIYERPNAAAILNAVKTNYPQTDRSDPEKDGHPRLMLDEADFDRIRSEIQNSTVKQNWLKKVNASSEYYDQYFRNIDLATGDLSNSEYNGKLVGNAATHAFLYQLLKESDPTTAADHAEAAWAIMDEYCDAPKWNSSSALMDSRCAFGLALSFDWLYEYLTEAQRQEIVTNVYNKFLPVWVATYDVDNRAKYPYTWWCFGQQGDNWNAITNRGAIFLGFAVCDEKNEEKYPGLSEQVGHMLEMAILSIERSFNSLEPDGAWFEGPSYWHSTLESMTDSISLFEKIMKDDLGFLRVPGLHETGYFPVDVTGVYAHNFGNASETKLVERELDSLSFLGDRYNDDFLKQVRYNAIVEAYPNGVYTGYNQPDFRAFAHCVGDPETGLADDEHLDYHYKVVEIAGMRSSWDPESALFASMETGSASNNSSEMDAGGFVLDAYGQRFFCDLGIESYTLPGGTGMNAYRNRAEGHNTLVINPVTLTEAQKEAVYNTNTSSVDYQIFHDQIYDANTYIDRFESNDVSCYAITDLTPVYANDVSSATRGLRMVDNRSAVLLQDEIKSDTPFEMYWFAHTQAGVNIQPGGKTAILTRNGVQLEAKIISAQGTFGVMDAQPLPGSPDVKGQNSNQGVQKLFIHLEDVSDVQLAVLFTPLNNAHGYTPSIVPLANWVLDEPDQVYSSLPTLSSLSVNGTPVAGFDPATPLYEVVTASDAVPTVTALNRMGTTEGVTVNLPVSLPGIATITVNDGINTNTYGIKLRKAELLENTISYKGEELWYLVGLYESDGKMVSLKHVTGDLVPGTKLSVTHTVPETAGKSYYLKAMLLTKEGLQPLKEADILGTPAGN